MHGKHSIAIYMHNYFTCPLEQASTTQTIVMILLIGTCIYTGLSPPTPVAIT